MDVLTPHRIDLEPRTTAKPIPPYGSVKDQLVDTAHRLQENVQTMPLASFALALLIGYAVGSAMTRATYHRPARIVYRTKH